MSHLSPFFRATIILSVIMLSGCTTTPVDSMEPWRLECCISHHDALLLPYTDRILVEIDYAEGWEPRPIALEALSTELHRATGKQIDILDPTPIPNFPQQYNATSIYQAYNQYFDHRGDIFHFYDNATTLYILYADGNYTDHGTVVGQYHDGPGFILILIEHIAQGPFYPIESQDTMFRQLERRAIVHEAGHAMGLVNWGVPMIEPRATRDECQCHSTKAGSAMSGEYYDNTKFPEHAPDILFPPWQFDEYDMADLWTYQEKARVLSRPPMIADY